MSDTAVDPRVVGARSAPKRAMRVSWSDPTFRAIVWQLVIVGIVVAIGWYLVHNTMQNLTARRIATGFGFLDRVAGIPIGESMIPYNPAEHTYARALWIGVLNTLKVAVVGVVLATILGTLIGIGRLSTNWLLARLTGFYVETIRDIPLLLQLLFWYSLLQGLPGPKQAWHLGDAVFLSNRGIKIPSIVDNPVHDWVMLVFAAGAVLTYFWSRAASRKQEQTGIRPAVWPMALAGLIGMPLIVWAMMGAPFQLEYPALRGFNFQGGNSLSPEYFALLMGLVIYTAGYILRAE